MNLAEIKESIPTLTVEERLEIAALITHLNHADDPHYLAELDRRLATMATGRAGSQADLERFYHDLEPSHRHQARR